MKTEKAKPAMPSVERIQQELGKAQSMDDFFGKEGIFARLFAETLEQMLDAELTAQLGYEPYEAKGRNSGNSRNGHYRKTVRTSNGETEVTVPRDRNGDYEPQLLKKYQANTNELEDKIIAMYARGMTQRDIETQLAELYGIEVSAQTVSTITNKVLPLVEAWQSRPLAAVYPILYLDDFTARSAASSPPASEITSTTSCARITRSKTEPFTSF
jgi:putative transposase